MSLERRPGGRLSGRRAAELAVRNAIVVGLVVLVAIFASQTPLFLTAGNIRDILLQVSGLAIVATTATMLLLSGYLDLSVGSVMAFSATITATASVTMGLPIPAAIALGVLAGALVGALNGWLTCYLSLSPIIVSLGLLTAVRGATLLVQPLPIFGFPPEFGWLGIGTVFGIPVPVIIASIVFGIGAIFLVATPPGRWVYAIGVNREAAFLSGLPVRRLPFLIYVASGASAALAGVIFAARLNSVPPGSLGVGFELDVLTAVLLGGVAFSGGRGSIFGVLIGVLILGVLSNGLILLNVDPFWQQVAKGGALIIAAALDLVATSATRSRRHGSSDSGADDTGPSQATEPDAT